ncbi:MAG: hypothetical protein B7733_06635 [Myxococcales bacterium FL481]|nr:MAG: hypothetical protein B7733_06635 [Myxococcales bacterium FL481]
MSQLIRRSTFLWLLFAAVLASGCAGLNQYAEGPEPAGPGAGQARIYFVLAQGYPGGRAFIVEEDKLIGFVSNRQYVVADVPAGEHLFMLISEQTEGVTGQFEAGKTYYMKMFITPGFGSTRVYWTPLTATGEDQQAREKGLAASRRVELNQAKVPAWEAKYAEKNRRRAANFRAGKDEAKAIGPEHGA